MSRLIAVYSCLLAFCFHAAIAQDVTAISRSMEFNGGPPDPKAAVTNSDGLGVALQGLDDGIPTLILSEIAQTPVSEPMGSSRSAKDAQIYKAISPAVVLVVNKESLGSGSLLSTDGTILTNYHVVKGYSSVAVVFKPTIEGAEPTRDDIKVGQVVKYDEITDLALIKVASVPAGRTPIRLGVNEEISVGEVFTQLVTRPAKHGHTQQVSLANIEWAIAGKTTAKSSRTKLILSKRKLPSIRAIRVDR